MNGISLSSTARGDLLYERARQSHIPVLDGLRGIAVITVMWLHFVFFLPRSGGERVFWHISEMGWIGVDLFFVLSGFLITGILYDAKGGPHYFRNFYMRRSLRIFPLYYAFLILIFAVVPLLRSTPGDPFEKQVWIWTYLSNVLFAREGWEGMPAHTTHLWSLAIEEQFYLLWPLLVWRASRTRLIQICLASIAVALFTRLALHFFMADSVAMYALMPARVDALAAGGLLAVLLRSREHAALVARYLGPIAAASGAAILLLMICTGPIQGDGMLPALASPVQIFGYTALSFFFAAMLGRAVEAPTGQFWHRMLTSRFLVAFGKYSYALYLFHILVRDFLQRQMQTGGKLFPLIGGSQIPAQLLTLAIGIGISYSIAFLTWHLFEKPILSLKRLFPYDRASAGHPVPAFPAAVSISPGADLGALGSAAASPAAKIGVAEKVSLAP